MTCGLVVVALTALAACGDGGEVARPAADEPRPTADVALGERLYRSECAVCHGSNGQGATAPPLADGEAVKTFPDIDDHIAWVRRGSGPSKGERYGDPNREGGQRGPATGAMPGFADSLSAAEIAAVVAYERERL